jgi:tetratricopeptide (TPR) repeat protein
MRSILESIGDRLKSFLEQRDDLALVLGSSAADSLPVLKILEGLEEESTSDLFWTITHEFREPAAYASAVVREFATRHEVVRLAMERRGMRPWPPIPPAVLAEHSPPGYRLRALAAFSRELLPVPNGGNNVWVLYPLEITDHAAYARLMAELLYHEFPFPWCHHLRFIVRADPDDAALPTMLAQWPRIQWYQPDLGMDAVSRGLEAEVANESLPLAERMTFVPIMAGMDYAMGRLPEALEKYELLLRFHAADGNRPMAAFALNGMGEVYEKLGDLDRANASYEAALIPASDGDTPAIPIWLNTVVNLGNLCMRQARWADGEAYFDVAQQLATVARDATSRISALDNRGVCQYQQWKLADAARSWGDGAALAATLQDARMCRALLVRLEQLYVQVGEHAAALEIRQQIVALDTPDEAAA